MKAFWNFMVEVLRNPLLPLVLVLIVTVYLGVIQWPDLVDGVARVAGAIKGAMP